MYQKSVFLIKLLMWKTASCIVVRVKSFDNFVAYSDRGLVDYTTLPTYTSPK